MAHDKIPVIVVTGPTASGKTALLLDICRDERLPLEVISCDSVQVHKGIDIGTAKPSLEERAYLPHHLVDICEVRESFDAGTFVRLADECAREIAGRGKLPVVLGGTMYYMKNFLEGLPLAPPSDEEIRNALKREESEAGIAALYEELCAKDPTAKSRIHPNDAYRILRALEIYRATGKAQSEYRTASAEEKAERESVYDFLTIAITRDRARLYKRIERRVDEMFARGLEGEARALYEAGFNPDFPALRAIGYREFFVETEGGWTFNGGESVKEDIKRNSRHYAKRQETFMKSLLKNTETAFLFNLDGDEGGGGGAKRKIAALIAGFWEKHRA